MSHPRDPRARRAQRDPLAAAVALELAADSMRAHLRTPEPEPAAEQLDPAVVDQLEEWDDAAHLTHTIAEEDDIGVLDLAAGGMTADEAATEQGDEYVDLPCMRCSSTDHFTDGHPDDPPSRYVAGGQIAGGFSCDHQLCELEDGHAGPHAGPELPAPPVTPAAPAPVFSSEHPPPAWRSRHDPRSLGYGVGRPGGLLRGSGPLQEVRLPTGPVLDQMLAGSTLADQSCCTGCGTVAAINAHRMAGMLGGRFPLAGLEDADRIYDRARQVDDFMGDDTAGTSVVAAMAAAVELGLIGGYLWCFGTRDIAQTVIQRRLPVVVGVRWLSGMWETGAGGLVELRGEANGMGHCLAIVGLTLKGPQGQPGPYFIWQNSAGESYGDGGFGYIHHRDLSSLLAGVGEAAVPTLEPQSAP